MNSRQNSIPNSRVNSFPVAQSIDQSANPTAVATSAMRPKQTNRKSVHCQNVDPMTFTFLPQQGEAGSGLPVSNPSVWLQRNASYPLPAKRLAHALSLYPRTQIRQERKSTCLRQMTRNTTTPTLVGAVDQSVADDLRSVATMKPSILPSHHLFPAAGRGGSFVVVQ